MKTFTTIDHARLLDATKNKHISLDEKIFLGHMANLAAVNEPVSDADYNATAATMLFLDGYKRGTK